MKEAASVSAREAITALFREHIAEVPIANNQTRWAILTDMQDVLAKHGFCEPSGVQDVKGFGLTKGARE